MAHPTDNTFAPPASQTHGSKNWLGIVALVTSLVGLSVPAVVFGSLGVRAASQGRATNRGMALAGLIIGIIGAVLSLVALLAVYLWLIPATYGSNADSGAIPVDQNQATTAEDSEETAFLVTPVLTAGIKEESTPWTLEAVEAVILARVGSEARIVPDGDSLLVTFLAPPTAESLDKLSAPVNTQWRPVLAIGAPTPSDGGSATEPQVSPTWPGDYAWITPMLVEQFNTLDCTQPMPVSMPPGSEPMAACASDGTWKYLLGTELGLSEHVAEVAVSIDGTTITLDAEGTEIFDGYTAKLAAQPEPGNQFAIVGDGLVTMAPALTERIPAGQLRLPSAFARDAQIRLAASLTFGTRLMPLEVESAS